MANCLLDYAGGGTLAFSAVSTLAAEAVERSKIELILACTAGGTVTPDSASASCCLSVADIGDNGIDSAVLRGHGSKGFIEGAVNHCSILLACSGNRPERSCFRKGRVDLSGIGRSPVEKFVHRRLILGRQLR